MNKDIKQIISNILDDKKDELVDYIINNILIDGVIELPILPVDETIESPILPPNENIETPILPLDTPIELKC